MAKGPVLIIDSLQIQRVLEEAVHFSLKQGPGMENGVIFIGADDSVGPYRGIAAQMGDNEVDSVGVMIAREGDRLISEVELTSTEERGVIRRFPIELWRRLDLEVFEYGGGDDRRRGTGWTRRTRFRRSGSLVGEVVPEECGGSYASCTTRGRHR